MSETLFPIKDLFRRKLQTSLAVTILTLTVASTLFLLLTSDRIGFRFSLMAEDILTAGFSTALSRFIVFTGILIFTVGALLISFMVFVMMSQRVRDIALMKAAGCPNNLIFGYLTTELLIITLLGCSLGAVFGILADFALTSTSTTLGFQVSQKPTNFWIVLLVPVAYFVLSLIFGVKPILDTTKIETVKALSPTYYLGVSKEPGFRIFSKSALTVKIALRSLFRRKLATIRILLCLTTVFILVTVAVAGGIIASQTTKNWIEKPTGRNMALIAHREICSQYKLLLSKFHEKQETTSFNYTVKEFLLPDELICQLNQTHGICGVDVRLIVEAQIREVPGYILDSESGAITPVGDSREGISLIVGVEPEKVLTDLFLEGEFLRKDEFGKAVIGDSIMHKMFTLPLKQQLVVFGESSNRFFSVTGICVDPINNGEVVYVPLKDLQNITGTPEINVILVKIEALNNQNEILNRIRAMVAEINEDYEVLELNQILEENLRFVDYVWSTILFLPFFSLTLASLCLMCYVTLIMTEQRQELGVLRALGAKPKTVLKIISWQTLIVLLSSYAVGTTFGTIITLMILVPEPLVTHFTVLEIAGWLLIALTATFLSTLYPVINLSKKSILELMA